jgi:hypothetical protein
MFLCQILGLHFGIGQAEGQGESFAKRCAVLINCYGSRQRIRARGGCYKG